MNKLVELKMVEVLYTSDGKEYVTPQHLSKEIRDELMVHGGNIHVLSFITSRHSIRVQSSR
jgi:hypothetical protein